MNALIVCGGTAGHVNPALAVASELRLREPDAKILFVGAGKELEKKLIPQAGFHLVNIRMSGLRRSFSPDDIVFNMRTLRNLATAGVKAEKLIRRFKPDAVIGTGGYICYPILKKASQMGVPAVVHESNAVPGLTTKLLSTSVDRVLTAFPGLEALYRHPGRVVFTGTPVRRGFVRPQGKPAEPQGKPAEPQGKPAEPQGKPAAPGAGGKPLVVSFWGSLGAERMNEMMAEFIKLNIDAGLFRHIHAAGKIGGAGAIKRRLKQLGAAEELPPGIEVREYIDDMQSVMAAAEVIVCRAGGSTIAELTFMGKPAILIPSPYTPNNQQIENANYVMEAGGALVLQEKDCTGEALFTAAAELLADGGRLKTMAGAQRALGAPDAAANIVDIVFSLCNETGGG